MNEISLLDTELKFKVPKFVAFTKSTKGLYSTNGVITLFPDKYSKSVTGAGIYTDLRVRKNMDSYLFISGSKIVTKTLSEEQLSKYLDEIDKNSPDLLISKMTLEGSSYNKIIFIDKEIRYVGVYNNDVIELQVIPSSMKELGINSNNRNYFVENFSFVYDTEEEEVNYKTWYEKNRIFEARDLFSIFTKIKNDIKYKFIDLEVAEFLCKLITKTDDLISANIYISKFARGIIKLINEDSILYLSWNEKDFTIISDNSLIDQFQEIIFDEETTNIIQASLVKYKLTVNPRETSNMRVVNDLMINLPLKIEQLMNNGALYFVSLNNDINAIIVFLNAEYVKNLFANKELDTVKDLLQYSFNKQEDLLLYVKKISKHANAETLKYYKVNSIL